MLSSYYLDPNKKPQNIPIKPYESKILTTAPVLNEFNNYISNVPIKPLIIEPFIEWDDPYAIFSPWNIIDFLRNFKLTK